MLEMVALAVIQVLTIRQEILPPKREGSYDKLASRDIATPIIFRYIGIDRITILTVTQLINVSTDEPPRHLDYQQIGGAVFSSREWAMPYSMMAASPYPLPRERS